MKTTLSAMRRPGGTASRSLRNLLAGASAMMVCGMASAQGWIQGFANIAALGRQGIITGVILCALGGVGAFAYAGKQLLKKSGDRGDDIEWSKIAIAMVAGVFLIAVSWVASTSVQTLGGNAGNVGAQITVQ